MERERYARVAVTLPRSLLETVDGVCGERGYTRSEFFRAAIRHYLDHLAEKNLDEKKEEEKQKKKRKKGSFLRSANLP
ncbi:CopG family ribbon-helix-helix protein [Infirmifilum sp.]|uniref:CopG family ribbon-helix-helix protein n=1 Tax=Infirmifilum sp. TaxID=2856575 RepID=UPI003D09EAC7